MPLPVHRKLQLTHRFLPRKKRLQFLRSRCILPWQESARRGMERGILVQLSHLQLPFPRQLEEPVRQRLIGIPGQIVFLLCQSRFRPKIAMWSRGWSTSPLSQPPIACPPPEIGQQVLWRGFKYGRGGGQSTSVEYFNGSVRLGFRVAYARCSVACPPEAG